MNIFKPVILYKIHENLECENLMNLTRYLYSEGFDVRPLTIQERNFPNNIKKLPTAKFSSGTVLMGYSDFVDYYQKILNVSDLDSKMIEFTNKNADYRITDNSTKRNLIRVPLK